MNFNLIKFLNEDLKLRHSRRSKNINLTIDGELKQAKSIEETASLILANTNIYKNNLNWQKFKTSFKSEMKEGDDILEVLPETLKDHISAVLSQKRNISSSIQKNIEAQAFNSFVKELSELPKTGFGIVDKMIIKRLRYCQSDGCIYVIKNAKLRLIGKLESLKKDPTQSGLCKLIKEEIGVEWNEGVPMKIDEYINMCLNTITELRHFLITEVKRKIDSGEKFEDVVIDIEDEKFIPNEKSYSDDLNALENAAHNYCVEKLWTMVPCSLFTSRVITLKAVFNTYEIPSGENGTPVKINSFVKYVYDVVRSGEALTESTYLKNILTTYVAELKDGDEYKLDEVPRTYADGDYEALFRYDQEIFKNNIKEVGCYNKLEDCVNLTLLKSWMNEDEFRLTMAWAYAAVHPCTVKSNIALLLWTGGGTGKSSLVAMIKYAMMLASGGREEDLYFEIKGDKFIQDDKNWQPDGQIGLPKAALVNIDEATTECIERYKNFSGSADKNRLTLRLNYENAVDYDVKGKFIFTTNKGLQLTSDDGSLLRRVAIIKHQGIQNVIGDRPKTNDEIIKEYKKQIPMMLALGKKSLDEIIEMGYSSLDAYAMKCDNINKNLKESTSSSANTEIYSQMWQILSSGNNDIISVNTSQCKTKDGGYKLQGSALKKLYEVICEQNGDDTRWFTSFKRFILDNITLFRGENDKKGRRNFLTYDRRNDEYMVNPKNCDGIYTLYQLRKEFVKDDESVNESLIGENDDETTDKTTDDPLEGFDKLYDEM